MPPCAVEAIPSLGGTHPVIPQHSYSIVRTTSVSYYHIISTYRAGQCSVPRVVAVVFVLELEVCVRVRPLQHL